MQLYLFDTGDLPDDPGSPVSHDGDPPAPGLTLAHARPYQLGWRDATIQRWQAAARVLGVAATGTGKSLGSALVIRAVLDGALDHLGRERRCLFVAHRGLLVRQAAAGLQRLFPDKRVEIEMGDERARGAADIVVACIDSLAISRRLNFFRPSRYAACVWDECHRYGLTGPKVAKVLHHFGPEMRHLGITATPDRTDGMMAFSDVAFRYDIGDAVADGFLVEPHIAYETGGEALLDGVKLTRDGHFDADDLAARMAEAGPVAAVVTAARKWSNYANGFPARRPTIVTCAGVAQAKRVALFLNEWHAREGSGAAAAIHCGMSEAECDDILSRFRAGAIQYVAHFDMLTEGFDSDRPKVLINGRPTKARWVFCQNAGRTLRPLDEIRPALNAAPDAAARRAIIKGSDKPGALIVDVVGTSHGLTCDLLEVLRTPVDSDDILEAARKRCRDRARQNKPADPRQELEAARRAAAECRAERERARDAAEAGRWKGVTVGTDLTTRIVEDPYNPKAIPGREPNWFKGKVPSIKMKLALYGAGIPRREVDAMSYWAAKKVLDVVFRRKDAGLCTYKQLHTLMRCGVDANSMTFEEASDAIDKLARNGWRWPDTAGGREQ